MVSVLPHCYLSHGKELWKLPQFLSVSKTAMVILLNAFRSSCSCLIIQKHSNRKALPLLYSPIRSLQIQHRSRHDDNSLGGQPKGSSGTALFVGIQNNSNMRLFDVKGVAMLWSGESYSRQVRGFFQCRLVTGRHWCSSVCSQVLIALTHI